MDETMHMRAYERQIAIGRTNGGAPTGDCARVVSRRNGEALCFLGDVAGHDSRASKHAREVEARVGELAGHMAPGALLTTLNSALEAVWPSDMFVSAVCLALDLETGSGTIALAGQMPPLVRSPTSTFWLDVKAGPALGILADQRYPEHTFVLGVDDLLVMVTDGITDPLATELDLLGLAALARIVSRVPPDPKELCALLLPAAVRSRPNDDATVSSPATRPSRRLAPSRQPPLAR